MAAKVVHVTTVHPANDNRILNKECRTLARAGYEVVLLAPHDREEEINGVQVRPLPEWSSRLFRSTFGLWAAARRALAEDPALYHLHDPELLLIAPILRRVGGGAVVFDMHENVPEALRTKAWIPRPLRAVAAGIWRRVEGRLLGGKPVIFAERSYAGCYPTLAPAATVQNMVPRETTAIEAVKRTRFTLAYVGGVTVGRGIEVMQQALEMLWAAGKDVAFDCVGPVYDRGVRERLDAFARRCGDRVRIHGRLPSEEAMAVAARAHVGMAVLQPRPNYLESFPTKMLEYMALGIPVVVSDFPLYRSVVETEDCGVCVDPEDPREVADAVIRLMENREEAAAMGRRGRTAVIERYNWETEGTKLLDFYGAVLAGV